MAAATVVCLGPSTARAAVAAAAPPPPPGVGIRLTEAPTNRRDDPRALTTIVDHVKPGTTFTRKLEATNGDKAAFGVKFYVRAASLSGGSFVIDDKNPGEITEWASITPATGTVRPGGAVPAVLTMTVPASATAGEYYGAAIVEKPPPPGKGARLASRAAIAIYLSVGAGGEPKSDFQVTTLTASRDTSGAAVVSAQVKNTGGRALSIAGDLRLSSGPGGLSAGPFPAKLGTVIGIGQSEPVTVLLSKDLPAGPWHATLKLRSGRIERTSEGTITFPAAGSGAPVRAKLVEDKKGLPWPAVIGGLIGLLALGLILFFFFKRRSRPEDKRDELIDVP